MRVGLQRSQGTTEYGKGSSTDARTIFSRTESRARRRTGRANKELLEQAYGPSSRKIGMGAMGTGSGCVGGCGGNAWLVELGRGGRVGALPSGELTGWGGGSAGRAGSLFCRVLRRSTGGLV
jgi:hypothetical protein